MAPSLSLTYSMRLQTFKGYWDNDLATARQLAAIGHVCDRPPLEAIDEGSHCVTCNAFVKREVSVKALDCNSGSYEADLSAFSFHQNSCTRLQVRIPLEPQSQMGLYNFRMQDVRAKWERRIATQGRAAPSTRAMQSSSLFSLPTELRLEIYKQVLPELDNITPILQLNRDSARVITSMGYNKTGPRDTTKVNILRTCRAVHEEAADLLYSNTTFQFYGKDGTKILYLFLRSIGQAGRDLIKSVDVQCGNREDAIAFALLASCGKLQSITIRLPRSVVFWSHAPIWCVDGISCLLALSGLKQVTFETPEMAESKHLFMTDDKPDAAIVRRELMRPAGSPSDTNVIDEHLNMQQNSVKDRV